MPSVAWRGRRMGHSNCVLWFNDRALPAVPRRPASASYANLQNRKLSDQECVNINIRHLYQPYFKFSRTHYCLNNEFLQRIHADYYCCRYGSVPRGQADRQVLTLGTNLHRN